MLMNLFMCALIFSAILKCLLCISTIATLRCLIMNRERNTGGSEVGLTLRPTSLTRRYICLSTELVKPNVRYISE